MCEESESRMDRKIEINDEISKIENDHRSLDTPNPNNTKKDCVFRGRSFLFTLNEIDKYDKLKELINNLKTCDYYISCLEKAPTTGHEHIHMYVHFTNPYRLSKKILDLNIHIDICKGSPKQTINYVKKDGNILDEWGTCPRQGGMRTVGELKEIKDPDELNSNELNTWLKIHSIEDNNIDVDELHKEVKIYYIFGPSGVGKTEKAKQIVRDNKDKYGTKVNMVKYENGFWNGIGSAKIAVYDEFRDSSMKPSEFINFIDYNVHPLNIKGGSIINRYELIIITSVQNPEYIYSNVGNEPRKQWLRRMEIIDMRPKEDNDIDIEDW